MRYHHPAFLLFVCTLFTLFGCAHKGEAVAPFQELLRSQDELATAQYEQGLQLHRYFNENGLLFSHEQIEGKIEHVLDRLYGEEIAAKLAVLMVRLPGENAFALPNGDVIFHLAMLAALADEEQLAFVLAHEAAHIFENHAWQGAARRKSKRMNAHIMDLLSFGRASSYYHYSLDNQKFSREQELLADSAAAEVLLSAGYSLDKAAEFFDMLTRYPLDTGGGSGTHPANAERKKQVLLVAEQQDPLQLVRTDQRAFDEIRVSLLEQSVRDKIDEQDLPGALIQIGELERLNQPFDQTECFRAEVFLALGRDPEQAGLAFQEVSVKDALPVSRKSEGIGANGSKKSQDRALAAMDFFSRQAESTYRRVLAQQATAPCALHGLGLVYFARGDYERSRTWLRQFVGSKTDNLDTRYARWILTNSQKPQNDITEKTVTNDNLSHRSLTLKNLGRTVGNSQ